MANNTPKGLEQLDFRLLLSFTNAYENLYNKGEISEQQLDQVLSLLDNYQQYTVEEFEAKLKEIFPNQE